MHKKDVFIVDAARTPIGKYGGALKDVRPDDMAAGVLKELVRRNFDDKGISKEINRKFIGKKLDVLIEGQQDGLLIGRSYRDAPDIDGLVFVEGKAKVGDIIKVRIHTALEYDLIGRKIG